MSILGITDKEAELMHTFSISLKMKNHAKIAKYFKDRFEQNQENIDYAFECGMCMSIYIIVDPNDSDKAKHHVTVNDSFTKCLQHRSDWWIARYLRSIINLSIPEEPTLEDHFPSYKKADPAEDRRILIAQQKNSPVKPSYFLCPYIAQTKAYILEGMIDEALDTYKTGLVEIPVGKSPFNLPYLSRPFYDTIVYFRKLGMTEMADEVKKNALILFPGSRLICMA
ncbi:MAG: hypothetical protein MUF15_02140 [Acidobacteria bacterium]|jgi:hypothetical protein|nr:hypothetical protein [Acidobacteriota bacterium]